MFYSIVLHLHSARRHSVTSESLVQDFSAVFCCLRAIQLTAQLHVDHTGLLNTAQHPTRLRARQSFQFYFLWIYLFCPRPRLLVFFVCVKQMHAALLMLMAGRTQIPALIFARQIPITRQAVLLLPCCHWSDIVAGAGESIPRLAGS